VVKNRLINSKRCIHGWT